MADEPGVRFGLASGAIVLVLLVASALPLDLGETAFVALVAAAAAGATLPWAFVLVLGTEAWAFFTGFFEHQYGVLTLTSHDLLTLAGFVAATVVLARVLRATFSVAAEGRRQ
jgi:hypothetical protein